ncbi:MAG: MFS transporter, partial [Acidimicrobiales bacterium]
MALPDPSQADRVRAVGDYELWFVCQLTFGLAYLGGAVFILPQFVLSLPGSDPGDVGIVMGVLPLIALGAPLVGGLLDRFGSHRAFQHLGLGLLAVGFGVLSLADELIGTTVGALVLGVGAALVLTTNLSLLAGSGLAGDVQARRLSLLQMSLPAGQVIGLLVVAGLLVAGVDFRTIFIVLALICVGGLAATAATNRSATERILRTTGERSAPEVSPEQAEAAELGAVLWSTFGLVLLVVFVSMTAHTGIESQYPNFMSDVFKIDGQLAAVGLAVAVLVSLPVYPMVGRWAQRVPFRVPLLVGIAVRGLAGLALWALADLRDVPEV